MSQKPSKEQIDAAYAAHEREQVLFIARNTTPDDRLKWLEEAIEFVRVVARERGKRGLKMIFSTNQGRPELERP